MNSLVTETSVVPTPTVLPGTPRDRLKHIDKALRPAQVMFVEFHYDNSGGVGNYAVQYYDLHRQHDRWLRVETDIRRQLTTFLWQLVEERFPHWEETRNAFGVLEWDVRLDGFRHFHHHRIIEVKTHLFHGL